MQAAALSSAAVWGGGQDSRRAASDLKLGAGSFEHIDAEVLGQAMVTEGTRIVTKSAKANWTGVHCSGTWCTARKNIKATARGQGDSSASSSPDGG